MTQRHNNDDERWMARALQLARQGAGHTSPNPMVGAVIVHDGRIVGEGFHRRWGQGHAEVNAVASVATRSLLAASTIYVTLEPCSHHGKTPPCAQLLIDCGFKRVVVGTLDPFVQVSGRGVAMLRQAGIEVTVGVLERECKALNRRFLTAHTTGLPWVMLKWAQSADGFIAPEHGSCALSTPLTQRLMHRERARVDAIVVGARTVAVDNPSLTTRHWSGHSPLRVVLDEHLTVPPTARLLTDGAPTLVLNAHRSAVQGAVEWVKLDTAQPGLWLRHLYSRGITSVMVEGGAQVLRQLIDAGAWHAMRVETAPLLLRRGVAAPPLPAGAVATARESVGGNIICHYQNQNIKPYTQNHYEI